MFPVLYQVYVFLRTIRPNIKNFQIHMFLNSGGIEFRGPLLASAGQGPPEARDLLASAGKGPPGPQNLLESTGQGYSPAPGPPC